jgi:hypothetical protein
MISHTSKSPSGNDTETGSWLSLPCAGPAGLLAAARAEALFTSDVSACSPVTAQEVKDAIRRAVRSNGGVRGCAAQVATAYGDHPETAAPRMRWARHVVDSVYGKSAGAANGCTERQSGSGTTHTAGHRIPIHQDTKPQGPTTRRHTLTGTSRRLAVAPILALPQRSS